MRKRYVVVNKARFVTIMCIFFLIILTLISIFVMPQKISSKSIDANTVYIVKSGDRLWDIASMVKSDDDIRKIINNISEANGISSDEHIYPGEILNIPYEMKS